MSAFSEVKIKKRKIFEKIYINIQIPFNIYCHLFDILQTVKIVQPPSVFNPISIFKVPVHNFLVKIDLSGNFYAFDFFFVYNICILRDLQLSGG